VREIRWFQSVYTTVILLPIALVCFLIFLITRPESHVPDRLEKFVPIPAVFDSFTASFEWMGTSHTRIGPAEIEIDWTPTELHQDPKTPYFRLEGVLQHDEMTYYLLEMDNRHYLEKAELIEPLIHGLLALSRGGKPHDHEDNARASIDALPKDRERLIRLISHYPTRIEDTPSGRR